MARLSGVRQPRQPPAAGMRFPLALCLGLVALATASQSPLQRRVVKEVLEYFHSRSNVQFFFKEQAVEGAVERVSARGCGHPRPPGRAAAAERGEMAAKSLAWRQQGGWGGGRGVTEGSGCQGVPEEGRLRARTDPLTWTVWAGWSLGTYRQGLAELSYSLTVTQLATGRAAAGAWPSWCSQEH